MRKILFLVTISIVFVQCNKQKKLPELAIDNDYPIFELKDRVCEVDQKVTLLIDSNYSIEDKNINYFFSPEGYLISDSIFDNSKMLLEVNTYKKFDMPLITKQFIAPDNFIANEVKYDSLKNIIYTKKMTQDKRIIEEKKNTLVNNLIIREDFFSTGSQYANKIIQTNWKNNLIQSKVSLNQLNQIKDSIAFEYDSKKQLVKEIYFNSKKQPMNSLVYTYQGKNISSITYLNSENKEESVEKYSYNKDNKLLYKSNYTAYDNLNYEEIYAYNDANKLIEFTSKLNGEKAFIEIFKYDEKGNLINFDHKNFKNNITLIKTIAYTYDKKGNWLNKKISFNNVPTYEVERIIKYCK